MTSYSKTAEPKDEKESKAIQDFQRAYQYKRDWLDMAQEDYEFAYGKQWTDADVKNLEAQAVLPLTVNKIWPAIQLIVGIESQNRTDAKAFPEGKEDDVRAEIATGLMKNVNKNSDLDFKHSEQFEDGLICAEGWIEPYLDYTDHPLFPKMKFRIADYNQFFPDPNAKEYDFSDGQFMDKVSYDLTKDQVLALYPDLENKIDSIMETGKLSLGPSFGGMNVNEMRTVVPHQDYANGVNVDNPSRPGEPLCDLLEHFYKKYVKKYWVADYQQGLKEVASKKEGDEYVTTQNANLAQGQRPAEVISHVVPEIWCCVYIGSEVVHEDVAWFYPKWKGWPGIPYRAKWKKIPARLNTQHIYSQGVTRGMKSTQQEFNKRRTQELRHLNSTANSGWLTPKDSWVDPDKVQKYGSTPGVTLEYDPTVGPPPERVNPAPLSQGHAQLAAESSQDMKESSGINAEQLALESGERSGRAIALRQKQGLVMVQKYFDNYSRTKKITYKFILSQLSEIYDVERAVRVMGDAFLQEHFSVPVMAPIMGPNGQPVIDPATGQPAMGPQIDPNTGQPAMQIDKDAVVQTFNEVLNDTELGNYDVAIGESAQNETIRMANFATLSEMQQAGVPIPPDVFVEESSISSASKKKILAEIQNAQVAARNAPPKKAA